MNSTSRPPEPVIGDSKNRNVHSSMDRRIDNVRLHEGDREAVKAHMHDADVVAELFERAVENLRSSRQSLASIFVRRAR